MVPTDGSAPGQGSLDIAAGSGHQPGFAASLGLDLKENWGLDVISREERSKPHDQLCAREERPPWGQGLAPTLPIARHLVTLCTCC